LQCVVIEVLTTIPFSCSTTHRLVTTEVSRCKRGLLGGIWLAVDKPVVRESSDCPEVAVTAGVSSVGDGNCPLPNTFGAAQCCMMVAMASIDVAQSDARDTLSFDVRVVEDSGATSHHVTVDASQLERLRRGDEEPERFIERCFEFLLAREPKESIMKSFDVSVISRYFPEFEGEISR
jgi:hypothetical protein